MAGTAFVRAADRRDRAVISGIYNESIRANDSTMDTEPVEPEDIGAWIDGLSSRETILVVEVDLVVRGWGIVKRYSDRPGYARTCETSVYLDRAWVGQGLGSLVQQRLMEFCRTAGYHHLVAKIWAENEASLAIHLRFGYTLVGVQREIGFVRDRWRDVAILQCVLDP